ncbi:MAG: 2-succinyl-5-enolpyruvyl-6-hydroxy-3-cyclohexene-1-carboxylic-acid synthase [Synechococcaceae cyanobacterium]|nr:2-succinyl-5-enolpyruvyl-6-hydroxy-3-cyclohexene-1-carboxylic-acid synthase [Synechococcaceae cyanobacterium]
MASASAPARNAGAALQLLAALRDRGLRHLVVCPGSRSAPLAVAAGLLEAGGVRLHTAIDERSAAFFALGLGRAGGMPAAVITTSGTAVAELLPAAVEADHGTIPLLLLTADRPARLKGCGANQSVNQESFLRCSCRWVGQGPGEGLAALEAGALARMAERALAAALGDGGGGPAGPVHLNLPFEEPLHADGAALLALGESLRLRAPVAPLAPPAPQRSAAPEGAAPAAPEEVALDPDLPGVVVAGPWRGSPSAWPEHCAALRRWQRRSGWPVLADVLSGLRGVPDLDVVAGYDLLLDRPPAGLAAPQVLRLGPLPASRRLERWLAALGAVQDQVSEGDPRPLDPLGLVRHPYAGGLARWVAALPGDGVPSPGSQALARRWRTAERRLQRWLGAELEREPWGEPGLARALHGLLPEGLPLLLANSSPVRDWETFSPADGPARPVHSFRGASGIDGTLSLACGLAEELGRLVLVSGDLALLHDSNGWLWANQLRGRLAVVVIDNGGGGIFEQLPIRTDPDGAMDFERLFAMPQRVDACAMAAVHGVASRRVERTAELGAALRWALAQPLALLSVATDRRADAALRQRLRTMAAQDLAPP